MIFDTHQLNFLQPLYKIVIKYVKQFKKDIASRKNDVVSKSKHNNYKIIKKYISNNLSINYD